MSPLANQVLNGGELAAFMLIAWRVIRALNRFESVMRDFPPHSHINGKIAYPKDFEPGRVETLRVNGASAGQ